MKVVILTVAILSTAVADYCTPKGQYWRVFNGTIPTDAFLAGTDDDGKKNYVARIYPLHEYWLVVPVLLKEGDDHIDFAEYQSKDIIRVDNSIQILCVDNTNTLSWETVVLSGEEARSRCCLVYSGMAILDSVTYRATIGKVVINGVNYIGRIYNDYHRKGVHIMSGANSTQILEEYDVLSYNCSDNDDE